MWRIFAGIIIIVGLAGCFANNPSDVPIEATIPIVITESIDSNNTAAQAPTATVLTIIAPPLTILPDGIATSIPPTLNISTAEPILDTSAENEQPLISTPANLGERQVSSTGCQVPADWTPYTLQQGDTLYGLSIQLETTVDAISSNNCLENPDQLTAGEVIYLPQAGATSTSNNTVTVPQSNVDGVMTLEITPSNIASNIRVLPVGDVQLAVVNVPIESTQVEFFLIPAGTNSNPQRIGSDVDLTDGATLAFTVNENLYVDLFAVALDANNAEVDRTAEKRIVADVVE